MNQKLTSTQITQILTQNYNITPTKITEIDRGTADIFKIQTSNKTYILKQFIEGRTQELVEKEIKLINYTRRIF